MTTTEAWVGEMPIRLFSTLILVSTIVSTLYIGGFLVYNWRASGRSEELANFVKVILFGIVANAFICGAISDPLDRYGARVIWLVPLIAALVFWQQRTPHSTDEGD